MMSAEVRAKLERELQAFDRSDSTQVAVLTIDSLEGDPIEDFSIRVAEAWKGGDPRYVPGAELFLRALDDLAIRPLLEIPVPSDAADAALYVNMLVEPELALGSGTDGLDATRIILRQAGEHLTEIPIVFYRTSGGVEPVRDWVRVLPGDDKQQIGFDLTALQVGWPVGMPLIRKLEPELEKLTNVTIYTFLYPIEGLHPDAVPTSKGQHKGDLQCFI